MASPDQLAPEADVPGPPVVLTELPGELPGEDGSAFGPDGGPDWQPTSAAAVRTHPTIPAASRRTVYYSGRRVMAMTSSASSSCSSVRWPESR